MQLCNDHGDDGDDVGDSVDGCNEYQVMITMELTMIANIEEFKKDDGGLLVRLVMMIRKILC